MLMLFLQMRMKLKAFTGEDSFGSARILSNVCEVAIVKLGERGSVVVSGSVQEVIEPEIVKPINTNGAGTLTLRVFCLRGLAVWIWQVLLRLHLLLQKKLFSLRVHLLSEV
jgi:hypothetical protein